MSETAGVFRHAIGQSVLWPGGQEWQQPYVVIRRRYEEHAQGHFMQYLLASNQYPGHAPHWADEADVRQAPD